MCYIASLGYPAFKFITRHGLEWLECASLARLPWLLHAFTTRRGGVSGPPAVGLNLGFVAGDRRRNVEQNRELLFRELPAENFCLASLRQVHSAKIYQVVRQATGEIDYRLSGFPLSPTAGAPLPAGDALLTDQAGILLSVRIADCLPVLLVDARRRAVVAIHAGWRGALQRILEKTVGEMRRVFGSRPEDLRAAVGPSIRACCYEVGEEVRDAFCGRFPQAEAFFRKAASANPAAALAEGLRRRALSWQPPGHSPGAVPAARLDLVAVARHQLLSAGLMPSKILVAEFCTACRTDLFFSYRKEGAQTGRMMAVVGMRSTRRLGLG